MIGRLHLESVLAAAYAIMLVILGAVLEWLAKHSHNRANQYHTGGFRFDRDRDSWECPMGIALLRAGVDHEHQTVHYRAPAHTCNACEIKAQCTHSDHGREIVVRIDPWVASASLRLQRGMSLVISMVAGFILVVELFRNADRQSQYLLGTVLALVLWRIARLASRLREAKGSTLDTPSVH